MELKTFTFVLRSPRGHDYEMAVPARKKADAERLLKTLLGALNSRDKILLSKDPQASRSPNIPDSPRRVQRRMNWADKNILYNTRERGSW